MQAGGMFSLPDSPPCAISRRRGIPSFRGRGGEDCKWRDAWAMTPPKGDATSPADGVRTTELGL